MGSPSQAAAEIKSIAARLRGFIEVADTLDKLGNLDQAVRDAETRKNAAYKDAEKVVAALKTKNDELAKADAEVKASVEKVRETVLTAEATAATIIAEAKEKAQELVRRAHEDVKNAEKQRASLVTEMAAMNDKTITKSNELAQINRQIQETKAKLAAI